jgi:DNA (cytosine-5)-methyltransferase 1
VSPTLTAMTGGNRQPIVFGDRVKKIRRLTPIECERLQGFPDNYTQIPYRGKPKEEAPVSKRYEAVGRAMSINVMEWLGKRIQKVHNV